MTQAPQPAGEAPVQVGGRTYPYKYIVAVAFVLACWGYDPQRGFGQLAKRGGPA